MIFIISTLSLSIIAVAMYLFITRRSVVDPPWIKHENSNCPIPPDTYVEVIFEDGHHERGPASWWSDWGNIRIYKLLPGNPHDPH